jgi:hypothetical protein
MSLELLISIAALLASIWAVVAAKRTAKEQNRLQGQLLELEKARERDRVAEATTGSLVAALSRGEHSARLIIANGGRAEARDVSVRVNGEGIDVHQLFRKAKQPISLLAPNAHVEFLMTTYDGMPDAYLVELEWRNPDGQSGQWRSELTMVR